MKKSKKVLAVLSAALIAGTSSAFTASAVMKDTFNDPLKLFETKIEECEMSYELKMVNSFITSEYKKTGNFKDILSGHDWTEGRYGNSFMSYRKENGKWEFIGAMMLRPDDEGKVIDFGKEAEKIKKAQNGKVIDITVGRLKKYKIYMIYYRTAEGEFVIPYKDFVYEAMNALYIEKEKTLWDYLEAGKTYTADEFMGKVSECYAEFDGLTMGDANGNGKVDVRDCSYIANALANKNFDLTPASDYNMDRRVNVRDAADLCSDLANVRQ